MDSDTVGSDTASQPLKRAKEHNPLNKTMKYRLYRTLRIKDTYL